MNHYDIQTYEGREVAPLAAFIASYVQAFPDAKLMAPEFYVYHPALEGGRNLYCAYSPAHRVLGFAPLFPVPAAPGCRPEEPHHIWTIIVADPGLPAADAVRDALFKQVLARARELAAAFPPRPARLAADMMVSQQPDIRYLLSRGFVPYDGVYVLQRTAAAPIDIAPAPAGTSVRHWRMAAADEQLAYLAAYNRCFPELPKTLDDLRFFLGSPKWAAGTAISAFDQQGRLVGSIMAYWDEAQRYGVTDDVFVLPEWRGQGIARCLIGGGLRYFRSQGITRVRLEVRRSNTAAVSLYRSMGYELANEEVLLGLDL